MSKLPPAQILIAVPTLGSIHPILVSRLILWGRQYATGNVQVHFYFTFKVAPVDRARNQIVEYFLQTRLGLEGAPLTHLLMIDSDTIPPTDAIERLLSHDLPVVTGLTPIISYNDGQKAWDTYDNCFTKVVEGDSEGEKKTLVAQRYTGLQELYRCGASCLLIKREVFEQLDKPFFKFVTNEDNTTHVRSEDIDFCDRVRALGISIQADTDVCCQHYKDIML